MSTTLHFIFSDFIERIGNKRRTKQVELILFRVLITAIEVCILASITVVFLDADPLMAIAKWSGFLDMVTKFNFPVILTRTCSVGILIYYGVIGIVIWAVITICLLHFTHEVLHYLNIYADEYLRRFSQICFRKIEKSSLKFARAWLAKRNLSTVVSSASKHHCLSYHRQFRLLFTVANKAYCYIAPNVGMFGVVLIILTNYSSIRYYGVIPMPFYLVLPLYSLAIFIIMCLIFPVASGVHKDSKDKYFLRKLYSEKPTSIDCGQFLRFKRSTEKALFLFIIEYTANSLILTR